MTVRFDYISERKEKLQLTGDKDFTIFDIDGQTFGKASLSTNTIGTLDGDFVNNKRANARSITITLLILKNVEETKRKILNIVKLKQIGTLQWEQNERTLEIQGVVEEIAMPRWTTDVKMQITMYCYQPFWENISSIVKEVGDAIALHYFTDRTDDMLAFPAAGIPFGRYNTEKTREINNDGDVSIGMRIEILAFADATNPALYNANGEYFCIGEGDGSKKVSMQAGEKIVITTGKGEKAVTLHRTDGTTVNLISKLKANSTWFQLETGFNSFTVESDEQSEDNLTFEVKYKERFI